MPTFAFRHIKDLYPVFWRKAREGVNGYDQAIKADAAKELALGDVENGG
jgi:hypothetical protein